MKTLYFVVMCADYMWTAVLITCLIAGIGMPSAVGMCLLLMVFFDVLATSMWLNTK